MPLLSRRPTLLKKPILAVLMVALVATVALADLTPWKDYELSEAVWSVSTIKVDSNMGEAYLEGIKRTWVASNEVSKKLGQIEDYKIYLSDLPDSGQFNMMLVVKFKSTGELGPNKARYDAFMKEWGEARDKETTDFAQKNYPAMREITGQYLMREVTLK
jgi:cytochrome b